MQPAFRQAVGCLRDADDEMPRNAMVERWQAYVEAGEQLDIAEEMMSLTLGIVGQALFSIDLSHADQHCRSGSDHDREATSATTSMRRSHLSAFPPHATGT